mmetsp:Transcript_27535/g.60603  ORF Transcript_27535/g.60603 Transcript_27535/m.60603 type:complete len:100 (-) Transcript_27535:645-944(-)
MIMMIRFVHDVASCVCGLCGPRERDDRETKQMTKGCVESKSNRRSFGKSKESWIPKDSVFLDDAILQGTQILDGRYSITKKEPGWQTFMTYYITEQMTC